MHVSLTRFKKMAICAMAPLAVALMAPSAFAQMAGTYTGTNNEGDAVQVVVSAVSGGFDVTGMSDGGAVYCKGVQTATYGVGLGLSGVPISGGKATVDVLAINLYYLSNLKFSGSKVTGTIVFAVPVFNGTQQPPKKACAATTKKQTFTATFGGSAFHAPPVGTAYAVPKAVLE